MTGLAVRRGSVEPGDDGKPLAAGNSLDLILHNGRRLRTRARHLVGDVGTFLRVQEALRDEETEVSEDVSRRHGPFDPYAVCASSMTPCAETSPIKKDDSPVVRWEV